MVAILQGQRDRFRARMLALEADVQARDAQLADANGRVAKLTADNVKLYEKVRYLQSFAAAGSGAGSGGAAGGGGSAGDDTPAAAAAARRDAEAGTPARARTAAGEDDFERPYRRMYQESLDPFADFSRREKARSYAKLSSADKITLKSSRFVLGNKHARTFMFFYVLALHLLVFATLWHFAHVTHAEGCGEDVAGEGSGLAGGLPAGLTRPGPGSLRGTGSGLSGGAGAAL
jgi:homeobox protein cut-like